MKLHVESHLKFPRELVWKTYRDKLVELVRETAREKNIPLQTDLVQGYGDDSAEMQKAVTALKCIPVPTWPFQGQTRVRVPLGTPTPVHTGFLQTIHQT